MTWAGRSKGLAIVLAGGRARVAFVIAEMNRGGCSMLAVAAPAVLS
jgi:hypothetical protein